MNDQSTIYRVPGGLLGSLGSVWEQIPGAISPFRAGGYPNAGKVDIAGLFAAGLCDAAGHVLPAAAPLLDVLGAASSFVRVYLSGGGTVREFVVYRDALSLSGSASLINVAGDFDLECPASTQMLVAVAAQMTGNSAFRSVEFEASLSGNEAVTLAAAIDLQRKASLRAIAEDAAAGPVDLFAQQVVAACATRTASNQRLCNYFLDLADSTGLPADRVNEAMKSLAAKGLLVPGQKADRLSDRLLLVAERLLLIDQALTLTAGTANTGGQVAVVGFTCLQAGIHDLLYIEVVDDRVELRMESAAAILEYVRAFLDDLAVLQGLSSIAQVPDASTTPLPELESLPDWHYAEAGQTLGPVEEPVLRERLARGELPVNTLVWNPKLPEWLTATAAGLVVPPPPIPVAPPPLSVSPACPRCHQALEPGIKFCTGCGLPVEAVAAAPTLRACPKCATPLEPGVRFCTGCGTPVN